MPSVALQESLSQLLLSLFEPQGLRVFVEGGPEGQEAAAELPERGATPLEIARAAARVFARRGLVTVELFDRLTAAASGRSADIELLRDQWFASDPVNHSRSSVREDAPSKETSRMVFVGVVGVVGVVAVLGALGVFVPPPGTCPAPADDPPLTGRVVDPSGAALPGVSVDCGRGDLTATTDDCGRYFLDYRGEATYPNCEFALPGYETHEVSSGDENNIALFKGERITYTEKYPMKPL